MKQNFVTSESKDGAGLNFLELGAGTGRATLFTRLAFLKAKVVALDLSAEYLKLAQEALKKYARHDFVEGLAERTGFQDQHFDAVYSVFMFHELPPEVRTQILQESFRVLKPGGFFAIVDSLQLGDNSELDSALVRFPQDFHEPFYTSYIKGSLSQLLEHNGFENIKTETGFFSKVTYATKPR